MKKTDLGRMSERTTETKNGKNGRKTENENTPTTNKSTHIEISFCQAQRRRQTRRRNPFIRPSAEPVSQSVSQQRSSAMHTKFVEQPDFSQSKVLFFSLFTRFITYRSEPSIEHTHTNVIISSIIIRTFSKRNLLIHFDFCAL